MISAFRPSVSFACSTTSRFYSSIMDRLVSSNTRQESSLRSGESIDYWMTSRPRLPRAPPTTPPREAQRIRCPEPYSLGPWRTVVFVENLPARDALELVKLASELEDLRVRGYDLRTFFCCSVFCHLSTLGMTNTWGILFSFPCLAKWDS